MTNLKELFDSHVDTTVKQQTLYITNRYLDAGYECWIVGGPTRDLLLGNKPKDIDFATNCPLETSKLRFDSVIPTGEDHGTLTIHIDGENYEVTRYRKDVDTDGRRATIEYAETIEEDVMRRDLTVNAIAFNPVTGEVIDAVGGLKDMEDRVLRFVGNTRDRVLEDHLRAIRYIRFVSRLEPFGFAPEDNIMEEIKEVFKANVLSIERIYQEVNIMFKTFTTNGGKGVDFAEEQTKMLNVFERFLIDKRQHDMMINRMFKTLDFFPLAYEYYMSSISSEKDIMQVLKLPKEYSRWVVWFEDFRKVDLSETVGLKDFLERLGGNYELGLKFCLYYELYGAKNNWKQARTMLKVLQKKAVDGQEEPYLISHLKVRGTDLIDKGLKGEKIGLKMKEFLQIVKADPKMNTKEKLLGLC